MDALQKIKRGDDLIDVWAEFTDIPLDVEKAIDFADKATELQVESMKAEALAALRVAMSDAETDSDRITAAKALLQHYRDEKKRLAAKPRIKAEVCLAGHRELFGSWDIKKPGSSL